MLKAEGMFAVCYQLQDCLHPNGENAYFLTRDQMKSPLCVINS